MLETIADTVNEAKATSDGWFLLGGDWNGRSLEGILNLFPDLKIIQTGPTRKDKTLDILLSNFCPYVTNTQTCFPIEGESGQTSDHKIVLVESHLPRPKAFRWEVHEYLKITHQVQTILSSC